MKSFNRGHKELLSKLNVEEFKNQCIKDLKSFKLHQFGYPPEEDEIPLLVEKVYTHSREFYGLKTQKEIKICLIAIHVGGYTFIKNKNYIEFMRNKEITNIQKIDFLNEFIDKQLDVIEERMNNE
ncbi:MAG: hypothetical protein ACWA5P_14580 [bacterium]